MYYEKDPNVFLTEPSEEITIKPVHTIDNKAEFFVLGNKSNTAIIAKNIVIDGIKLLWGGGEEFNSLFSPNQSKEDH